MQLCLRTSTLALLAMLGSASQAFADDGEVCRRARSVMGADATRSSAEDCQRALDAAEEETWQLWLDGALAADNGGDKELAVASYQRLVDAADRRGPRLSDSWARQRDEARSAIGRIDQELLLKGARVNISSIPEGAEVTVGGAGSPSSVDKTPTIHYFAPGSHSVRVRAPDSGETRELRFTVERGQTLELKIDLRKGAPTMHGVIEGTGPAMRGQTPGPGEVGAHDGVVTIDNGAVVKTPPDDDDGEGPPQTQTTGTTGTTIGIAAISVGAASLAAGTVFLLSGKGLRDDFQACKAPGSGCTATAKALNQAEHDADVQYNRATAAYIAGGVLVVGGIIAVLVFDDVGVVEHDSRATTITPWVSPDGAGVAGSLRF